VGRFPKSIQSDLGLLLDACRSFAYPPLGVPHRPHSRAIVVHSPASSVSLKCFKAFIDSKCTSSFDKKSILLQQWYEKMSVMK